MLGGPRIQEAAGNSPFSPFRSGLADPYCARLRGSDGTARFSGTRPFQRCSSVLKSADDATLEFCGHSAAAVTLVSGDISTMVALQHRLKNGGGESGWHPTQELGKLAHGAGRCLKSDWFKRNRKALPLEPI